MICKAMMTCGINIVLQVEITVEERESLMAALTTADPTPTLQQLELTPKDVPFCQVRAIGAVLLASRGRWVSIRLPPSASRPSRGCRLRQSCSLGCQRWMVCFVGGLCTNRVWRARVGVTCECVRASDCKRQCHQCDWLRLCVLWGLGGGRRLRWAIDDPPGGERRAT